VNEPSERDDDIIRALETLSSQRSAITVDGATYRCAAGYHVAAHESLTDRCWQQDPAGWRVEGSDRCRLVPARRIRSVGDIAPDEIQRPGNRQASAQRWQLLRRAPDAYAANTAAPQLLSRAQSLPPDIHVPCFCSRLAARFDGSPAVHWTRASNRRDHRPFNSTTAFAADGAERSGSENEALGRREAQLHCSTRASASRQRVAVPESLGGIEHHRWM